MDRTLLIARPVADAAAALPVLGQLRANLDVVNGLIRFYDLEVLPKITDRKARASLARRIENQSDRIVETSAAIDRGDDRAAKRLWRRCEIAQGHFDLELHDVLGAQREREAREAQAFTAKAVANGEDIKAAASSPMGGRRKSR